MQKTLATSFATTQDIQRYKAAKTAGKSELDALAVGDNGKGCWGDDTTTSPACALPREIWQERYGKGRTARGKKVRIIYGNKTVICSLLDTMPSLSNIRNGAGIDINEPACKALGIAKPDSFKGVVFWTWEDNLQALPAPVTEIELEPAPPPAKTTNEPAKSAPPLKGYRTLVFSLFVVAFGALQTFDFTPFLTPHVYGLVSIGIGAITAMLRSVTNTPVTQKTP